MHKNQRTCIFSKISHTCMDIFTKITRLNSTCVYLKHVYITFLCKDTGMVITWILTHADINV